MLLSVSAHMVLTIHPSPNPFTVLIQHVHPQTRFFLLAGETRVKLLILKMQVCIEQDQNLGCCKLNQVSKCLIICTSHSIPPPIPTQHSCIIHDGFPIQIQNPRLHLIKLRAIKRGKMVQAYNIVQQSQAQLHCIFKPTRLNMTNFIGMLNLQHYLFCKRGKQSNKTMHNYIVFSRLNTIMMIETLLAC